MELKRFFASKKSYFLLGLVLFFASTGVFGLVWTAKADILKTVVVNLIAPICGWLIGLMSALLMMLTSILIWIAGYNDFINAQAVVNGWAMTRDLANMFFIIILLIVAFGTILGEETLHYKKLLPKILIMALLINFSRTLAGLLIDMAQVVMITFVNGFSAAAGGNITNALQIDKIMKFKIEASSAGDDNLAMQAAGVAIFGLVILIISVVFITVMVAVLAFRIFMLWMLIILSPIAWLLGTVPQGQKYYAQWWEQFRDQVVVGPVLAFFLWLTLATVGNGVGWTQLQGPGRPDLTATTAGASSYPAYGNNGAGISQIMTVDAIVSYIVAIGMLLAGLQISQQMGGGIAGIAGKAKSFATRGLKLGAKMGIGAPLKGAGMAYALGARKLKRATGLELNPVNIYRGIKEGLAKKKKRDIDEGNIKAGGIMRRGGVLGAVLGVGAPGWTENYLEGFLYRKGIKRILYGKQGTAGELDAQAEAAEKEAKELEGAGYTDEEKIDFGKEIGKLTDAMNTLTTNLEKGMPVNLKEFPAMKELIQRQLIESKSKLSAVQEAIKEESDPIKKGKLEEDGKKLESEVDYLNNAQNDDSIKINPDSIFANEQEAALKEERDRIMAEKNVLEEKHSKPTLTSTEKERNLTNAQSKREEAAVYRKKSQRAADWVPIDYESRAQQRQLVSEKMKEVSTSNEDELINFMNAAITRHDPMMAAAVAYQAAGVGHLNELIMAFQANRDHFVKNPQTGKDELVAKRGDYFSANAEGLNGFMQSIFMDKFKFGKQPSLSIQNDLSATAEGINHWTYAQSVGVEKDGTFRQRPITESNKRVAVERSKKDFERLNREGNRLSSCTERWIDNDPSKGREAVLNPYRIYELKSSFRTLMDPLKRGRYNKNEAQHLVQPTNMKILNQIKLSLPKDEQAEFDKFIAAIKGFVSAESRKQKGFGAGLEFGLDDAKNILKRAGVKE